MNLEKISIRAKDELTSIVDRVIKSEADEIILDLPKTSNFGRSLLNFQLLKREADSAGKRIAIDCENPAIQDMAVEAGFEVAGKRSAAKKGQKTQPEAVVSREPLRVDDGARVKKIRNISDIIASPHVTTLKLKTEIVPQEENEVEVDEIEDEEVPIVLLKGKSKVSLEEGEVDDVEESFSGGGFRKIPGISRIFSKVRNIVAEEDVAIVPPEGEEEIEEPELVEEFIPPQPYIFEGIGRRLAKIGTIALVLLLLGAGIYAGIFIFPRAEIELTMKEIQWEFKDAIAAQNVPLVTSTPPTVPIQIIPLTKSIDLDIPTTGQKDVSQKAKGKITIFNAYSSQPQSLVATTRFEAPDGKVFRLEKGVTVPGAKITNGSIVPSSIEAAVIADKPGEAYNIGATPKFTIPGFANSPKFNSFYGQSKDPMTGGFVGFAKVVAQTDIDHAKKQAETLLSAALTEELNLKTPKDLKSIEGMSDVNLSSLTFSHAVGEKADTFKISGSLVLKKAFFREEDVRAVLQSAMKSELQYETTIKHDSIEYGVARTDFAQNRATFPIQYSATLIRAVDTESLKAALLGKSKIDTKPVIFAVPGLESAKVTLWPFWVRSVPKDPEKLKLIIQ